MHQAKTSIPPRCRTIASCVPRERSIRYLPGRFDAYYSAKEAGKNHRLEAILYPNSLVTVKTLPLEKNEESQGLMHDDPGPGDDGEWLTNITISKYTKHYYIGSERVASALGSIKSLGMLCEGLAYADAALIAEMNEKVEDAGELMGIIHNTFEKDLLLPTPFFYNEVFHRCDRTHYQDMYHPYWYHPDHLGSSSYITNLAGEINQHMEYLPFGELLVEEHLSSYNSPFKFNAKEFDAETGNYYYGARYYNPKWSVWLSVDAEFARFPSYSPYNYTLQNPVRYIDPDGNSPFDHYFSSDGRYLGSDNRSTNNIRIMQNSYGASGVLLSGFDAEYAYNNSTTLSSFNYSDKQNVSMLKNVASHYQNEVGLSANGPMDVRDHNASIMHVMGDGPAINVSRHNGAGISPHLDDANNFMSVIIHEDGHRRDGVKITDFQHTSNYLTQTKHDTWINTTSEYRNSRADVVSMYLNNAINEGVSNELIQGRVNEFNSVPFGIQLHYDKGANLVTPVIQLEPVNLNNN